MFLSLVFPKSPLVGAWRGRLGASSHPVIRAFLQSLLGEHSRITLYASVTRGSQRLKYNLSLAAPLTIELPRMLHRGTTVATIERKI